MRASETRKIINSCSGRRAPSPSAGVSYSTGITISNLREVGHKRLRTPLRVSARSESGQPRDPPWPEFSDCNTASTESCPSRTRATPKCPYSLCSACSRQMLQLELAIGQLFDPRTDRIVALDDARVGDKRPAPHQIGDVHFGFPLRRETQLIA